MSEEINNLKGIFANVNDDMLLRDCGNLYAENKRLQQENQQLKEKVQKLKHIMYVIRDDNGLNHLWCKDMILDWLRSDNNDG